MSYWWVNQGDTYVEERDCNCIFASKMTPGGVDYEHHRAIMRLRLGDIIFHYVTPRIIAVSIVRETPREERRPYEKPPAYQRTAGYLARVEYRELDEPILRDDIPVEWRLNEAPFNHVGGLKQQYLNPLSVKFVHQLVGRFPRQLPPELFGKSASHRPSS